jgi:hypothetical protein
MTTATTTAIRPTTAVPGAELRNRSAAPGEATLAVLEPALRARLAELLDEGWAVWERYDRDVRGREWGPFVAADYDRVLSALLPHRLPAGRRFLELGSATGVITIMADMLGFEAYGIELDGDLVDMARELADRFDSRARFAHGSFLPSGYRYRSPTGDWRTGTIGTGRSGYLELGVPLDEFDVVFGYPWTGEEPVMIDLVQRYGSPDTVLLLLEGDDRVKRYGGRS